MGAVRKARAAIKAAKVYQPAPLPKGLRHLFQPYVPTQPGTKTKRRGPVQVAPQIPVGKDLMEALIEHQGGVCPACDDWLEMDPAFGISHPLKPSFDHVMPRSRGGVSVGNKLVMHRECNCAKGNRLPTGCERIWLAAVNARLGL